MKKLIVSIAILAAFAPVRGGDLASLLVPLSEMKQAETNSAATAQTTTTAPAAQPAPVAPPKPVVYAYVGQNELLDDLRTELVAKFAPDGTLSIETVAPWKTIQVPDSRWKANLTRVSVQGIQPRMTLNFRIVCGDETVGEYQIQITCSVMREVLVSTRRFNRADPVSASDFQIQTRDILDVNGTPVRASAALDGIQTRSPISEGQVLCTRDIEERPLVHKGQVVEAVAVEGKMRIAVKAVAMEDGREGDLINVRNSSSNKDIQAKILNDHTVQVYF
jgi:flagella basal body P-ring formation protein FlgA